jgi:LCP family protein required for cell wall assembly
MEGRSSVSHPSDQNNSSNQPEPDDSWKTRYIEKKTVKANQSSNPPVISPSNGTIDPATNSKKIHWWRWAAAGLVVILLGFGLFTYIRVSSFLDNSFNGRNEASLLTPASTPTRAPLPTATISSDRLTAAAAPAYPTATPGVFPAASQGAIPPTVTPFVATPTAMPTPTVAPDYPEIIQKIKRGEQLSILVTGYGGGKHDGAYLTDTILELTYDPAKNAVTMVNIPRDLFVFIPYGGPKIGYWGKINSAFSYVMQAQNSNNFSQRYRFQSGNINSQVDAAANLLKDVVEQITGTKVDYWVTFSFDGFRKFIDAIGGIDVNVDTTFDDYEYPANDDPSIDASVMHIHFDAGLQHLQGEKAIQYARSRKSLQDGSDFGRSKRQMKVISAVKEKAARPDVMFKVFGLMDALQGNMRTSLSVDEARGLLSYYQGEGGASLGSLLLVPQILSTSNFLAEGSTVDGAYILYPYAGQSNYTTIQNWLKQGREFPQLRLEGLRVQVQNGTGLQASALKVNSKLVENGLDTLDPIWAYTTETSSIIDYSDGKGANTLKAISDVLPGVTVTTMKKPQGQLADIVVLVGKDYTEVPVAGSDSSGNKANTSDQLTPPALNLPANLSLISPSPSGFNR